MKVTTLGIDLAKNVFQLHGVNEFGKTVIKKQMRRDQMAASSLRICLLASLAWKHVVVHITGHASWKALATPSS